jgi:hypothetical protein
LDAATTGYAKITELVASLPPEHREATFNFEDRDRNVRDVCCHLVAWHKMMRRWYDEGMAGEKPAIPAAGYTFQTTPALNAVIWQNAQQISLADALNEFAASHQDMLRLIDAHSDVELFTKRLYPWTGTTSLGAYLISATSSHYDWALKKLRQAKKTW